MLDRFKFKLMLAFLMVLDHIDFFVPDSWNIVFGIASRCVAVGFAYLAVEGFIHTRDVKKYLIRLYGFAIFMLIGNYILNGIFADRDVVIRNSILMELAIGVSILYVYRDIENIILKIVLILGLLYASSYFEGGMLIPIVIFVSYIFWNNEFKRNMSYISIALYYFSNALNYSIYYSDPYILLAYYNYFIVITIPILKLYNGEVGLNNAFSKYFFYVFYPLHLWIIASITYSMKN